MKKVIIAVLLAVACVLAFAAPVFADPGGVNPDNPLNCGDVIKSLGPGGIQEVRAAVKAANPDVPFGQILKAAKLAEGLVPGQVGK